MKKVLFSIVATLLAGNSFAQLAKDNKCKFLGNITTSYNWTEYCDPQGGDKPSGSDAIYSNLWDQVTCENATKWGSVHKGWGNFNWTNADRTYNYCKEKGIIFKFHALIWGSQHPEWIRNLSVADTKKAIVEWFDQVKKHYPDLKIIDVVNEAVYGGSNYHSPYKQTKIIEALTSLANDRLGTNYQPNTNGYRNNNDYQWIAEAFRLAEERWPNATLIYNDYNTFQWNRQQFIDLINGLKACKAPIDAAGCQSHDLNDLGGAKFKEYIEEIHNKINMPIYITEYDIADQGDNGMKTRYSEQFPTMWEADYVPGVTLWGWINGKTWVNDSGLYNNGRERPAMTWLKQYMATSTAKNASATVCGKAAGGGASLMVEAAKTAIAFGDSVKISAVMNGATHIEFKNGDALIVDKWRLDPCEFYFTPKEAGEYKIDATGYNSKNETAKASLTIKVIEVGPYGGKAAEIPGKIEAENYDNGFASEAFFDLSAGNKCDDFTNYYRSDDVDIKQITGGAALGSCQEGEWMKYTVNVAEEGDYDVVVRVGEGNDNGKLSISCENEVVSATVDKTGAWGSFDEVKIGKMHLAKGQQVIKLSIDQDWIDVDWISFQKDPTSVSDYANNNVISVIPNPASTKIEILGAGEDVKVEFVSLAGSVIKVANGTEISLDDVANGVYMLRITTPSETIIKKQVVKK